MRLLGYTKQRLNGFLNEIDRLGDSDFPYAHSRAALDELRFYFQQILTQLDALDASSDTGVVKQHCALALRDFFVFLPLLGFVLRSTNVRNAFELFRPLLRLARQVLEPDLPESSRTTRLLLSSEWDYSPLTYTTIPNLPGYVFIGFPAPESGNPLLLPLAGHELGHPVWLKRDYLDTLSPLITNEVVRLITTRWTEYSGIFRPPYGELELTTRIDAIESWQPSVLWCLKQAEESFCDYLGLELFGESFLHAFCYLLSPTLGHRTVFYPPLHVRALRLRQAALAKGVQVPADYDELFEPDTMPQLTKADRFLMQLADDALETMLPRLGQEAALVVRESNVEPESGAERNRLLERFRQMVPLEGCKSIGSLLNAAWSVALDDRFWVNSSVPVDRRDEILKELVLKNLEVMEIERIQQDASGQSV